MQNALGFGRGSKIRTHNKGFGDPRNTIFCIRMTFRKLHIAVQTEAKSYFITDPIEVYIFGAEPKSVNIRQFFGGYKMRIFEDANHYSGYG